MLSYQILNNLRSSARSAVHSRNIGVLAPCLQKATDPIQQLFVDKIREYKQKSNNGKNLVEPTPQLEKELKQELEKVTKQYGGAPGVDMTKFPDLKFQDPVLDPINMDVAESK
ncbi:ATP synthase-coupling factor 6, mitochondrial [Anthonomus grandis grandis]|uniref:ATP synthase-coupling factor 6, mitochondrial n=1 Tax=Anthonomus grandis grandis TaxID=2921223 RepID=UPI00216565E9|nr:ATP synthase-coupling factor 6, mitochondrial [Anthonomus grandis grandis]